MRRKKEGKIKSVHFILLKYLMCSLLNTTRLRDAIVTVLRANVVIQDFPNFMGFFISYAHSYYLQKCLTVM